jgi:hypothetical protein
MGRPTIATQSEPPPEPGSARREAPKPKDIRSGNASRRLRERKNHQLRPQGGGPWGNQGFPRVYQRVTTVFLSV